MGAVSPSTHKARDFEDFARAEAERLLRTAGLLTGSVQDAEDLTQEALIQLYRRWDRVSAMHSPGGYAHRTLVNVFLSGKRRKAHKVVPIEHAVGVELSDDMGDLAQAHDLTSALMTLPDRQRMAVVLRYYEHLDTPSIAEVMRVRPGTARSLVSRGVEALRQHPYYQQGRTHG